MYVSTGNNSHCPAILINTSGTVVDSLNIHQLIEQLGVVELLVAVKGFGFIKEKATCSGWKTNYLILELMIILGELAGEREPNGKNLG